MTSSGSDTPRRRLGSGLYGLLWLIASPSSYMLIVATALTAATKLRAYGALERSGDSPLAPLTLLAGDLVVYLGAAALLAVVEVRAPRSTIVTVPLAAMMLLFAAVSAALLGVTGEQLTREALSIGMERFGDVWPIVAEQLSSLGPLPVLAGVVVLVAVHWVARRSVRSEASVPDDPRRLLAALSLAAAAAASALLAPEPGHPAVRRLSVSAPLGFLIGTPTDLVVAEDAGGPAAGPRTEAAMPSVTKGPGPNVVVLILESLRYDYTPLPDEPAAAAEMPNTLSLARRGAWTRNARAVLPHTTKSLYTMFCGRLPAMQRAILEVTADWDVDCAPDVLARGGYRTAFFQSALGTFEQRPRLLDNLGFAHFEAWEDISGEPLGYLASDDESLAGAFAAWLDRSPGEPAPFLAVLLTSATHHPYRLSSRVLERLGNPDPDGFTDEERYRHLVEAKDRLLGEVLAALDTRGLTDETIVVLVGDHGEGFGTQGVKQHDNNFYEEGLRIPLIVAGPGVPRGPIEHDVTLTDFAETLLELTRVASPDAGIFPASRSIFAGEQPGRTSYFSCWYDGYCYGFVRDGLKVVVTPVTSDGFYFDLGADPGERAPTPLGIEFEPALEELKRVLAATRGSPETAVLREVGRYGEWRCPPDQECRHPNSPEEPFFEKPGE